MDDAQFNSLEKTPLEDQLNADGSSDRLNELIELLYEESSDRLQACASLCQLSILPSNLPIILDNQPLICALGRLLREDCRKQPELAALILGFFASICYFRNLQAAL